MSTAQGGARGGDYGGHPASGGRRAVCQNTASA
eukprot:CAMPEP_0180101376 /NCGR_PEP_ID=MMETSP0985-20121206/29496_1 /TAXON_ID=483367 /ORGANISM="non described non described, Strain CCMP 2436" /LENGTH=32 /DNA_ID= /DNA_START= /DNA_END= /DNA_ORIENTATION=